MDLPPCFQGCLPRSGSPIGGSMERSALLLACKRFGHHRRNDAPALPTNVSYYGIESRANTGQTGQVTGVLFKLWEYMFQNVLWNTVEWTRLLFLIVFLCWSKTSAVFSLPSSFVNGFASRSRPPQPPDLLLLTLVLFLSVLGLNPRNIQIWI